MSKRFPDVGTLELELVPGGGELRLDPVVEGDSITDGANTRRIEVPIERNLAPGTAVRLRIDLDETLHGNWFDTRRSGRLQRLVLQLPNAPQLDAVGIERLVLRRRGDVEGAYAARAAPAEVDGVFHPSWWVRGGAHVDFELEVPADGELRWSTCSATPSAGSPCGSKMTARRSGAAPAARAGGLGRPRSTRSPGSGSSSASRAPARASGSSAHPASSAGRTTRGCRREDFLLYMMDSVRADHVGVFGDAPAGRSPTLDRLAKEGIGFARALSHSPWTKPAIATLLTGILPTTHRVGSEDAVGSASRLGRAPPRPLSRGRLADPVLLGEPARQHDDSGLEQGASSTALSPTLRAGAPPSASTRPVPSSTRRSWPGSTRSRSSPSSPTCT